jgi:CrcB protein
VSVPNRAWVLLAVALGGALGTVARYELALAEPVGSGRFPWATFVVNVVGSLVLGVALAALVDPSPAAQVLRPFVGVGFCGGLTTFSTWMVESMLLIRDGNAAIALGYLVISLAAGLAVVAAAVVVTRRTMHRSGAFAFDPERDD